MFQQLFQITSSTLCLSPEEFFKNIGSSVCLITMCNLYGVLSFEETFSLTLVAKLQLVRKLNFAISRPVYLVIGPIVFHY